MEKILSQEEENKRLTLEKRVAELDRMAIDNDISSIGFEVCLAVASFDAGVISYKSLVDSYKQAKRRAR